ncbi:MAG: ABC transporter ATP-binding protein [Chloroflexota bacterium]
MSEPVVKVAILNKTYDTPAGPMSVLRGINLSINRGEFVAIVGPSGGGKTTLLNMLTAIDRPTGGQVVVDGVDVINVRPAKLTRWRGRTIGIIFQFFQLLPTLTVLQNVMVPMDFCNVHRPSERRDRAMVLLERFDVAAQANKTPDMLSGGQQQRVAIARALANDAPLIVGDEPTGNLDRMSAAVVFEAFHELAEAGRSVLIVTHDRELVRTVPRVLTLSDGIIDGTPVAAAAQRRSQELQALRLKAL